MKIVKGDLLDMFDNNEFDIIVHGCNCFNTMGAGIAKQIKERYPRVYEMDCDTIKGDKQKLGTVFSNYIFEYDGKITKIIVNAYTQYKYNGSELLVDYDAVRSCFKQIRHISDFYKNIVKEDLSYNPRIGYPKIGAGLAGGDWNIISKIINKELDGLDHTLVEWNK